MFEARPVDPLSTLEIRRNPSYSTREFVETYSEKLGLRTISPIEDITTEIRESTLNRPGLALAGFTDVYTFQRIQVLGSTCWSFLESQSVERRREIFERLSRFPTPLWVLTHNLPPHDEMLEMCLAYKMPLVVTSYSTLSFIEKSQRILEEIFAAKARIHASLVDVYGVGMLYIGQSNIGKSECVLDLVERGHRMVADDGVDLVRLGNKLIGMNNHIVRHHMEVRGVGIIDIRSLFGIHAVSGAKKIDLIVELQKYKEGEDYQRTGLDDLMVEVMGVSLRKVIIPVSPGKNITVISEVVAMDALLRRSGVNAAVEHNNRLQEFIRNPVRRKQSERSHSLELIRQWYE